jgi:bisphosphoglycerate-independent phosphoglycerate mutase (AlkP superfamily)
MAFNTVADLKAGRAVYHDFTNQLLRERGEDVALRTPEEAAGVLASVAANHRFTLYEHFITDKAGHAQNMDSARVVLQNLARMIRSLLAKIDLGNSTVILTSDHGNIEDLSTRSHTLNSVPTIVWGAGNESISGRVTSLAHLTPAIVDHLAERRSTAHG